MSSEPVPAALPSAVPTLWYAVAVNLFSLLVAVVLVGVGDDAWPIWLPVVSLAVGALVGCAALTRRPTRPFGVGCLGGTAVSALAYLLLFSIFFVTYFIVPGGHELS